jgi:hypothetical protein
MLISQACDGKPFISRLFLDRDLPHHFDIGTIEVGDESQPSSRVTASRG